MSGAGPSNTSVERAGALLRAVAVGDAVNVDPKAIDDARAIVEQFRLRFLEPHLELRDELARLAPDVLQHGADVTSRWKRHARIVDKLVRLPRHRLPQMQDIGGCRIVVRSPQIDLDGLAAAVADRWELPADDDYVTRPRQSGYRARHLVARYSDVAVEGSFATCSRISGPSSTRASTATPTSYRATSPSETKWLRSSWS